MEQEQQQVGQGQGQTYGQLMDELTQVMKIFEDPAASLEEQLASYEKGMSLCQNLEGLLKEAEEKVMIINAKGQEQEFD